MSLAREEREQAVEQAAIAGFIECPDCGGEIVAHDDGTTPARGGMPAGAYVVCDSCGWEFPGNG